MAYSAIVVVDSFFFLLRSTYDSELREFFGSMTLCPTCLTSSKIWLGLTIVVVEVSVVVVVVEPRVVVSLVWTPSVLLCLGLSCIGCDGSLCRCSWFLAKDHGLTVE